MNSKLADNKIVQSWLRKAGKDLRSAKVIQSLNEDFLELAVFLCQQSAEKSIKGFLSAHKKSFKKTHNIEELLRDVATIDSNLARSLESAESLTRYAVAFRYPDASNAEEVTKEKVTEATKIAEKVYNEINEKLN